jgi:hypothetical protein
MWMLPKARYDLNDVIATAQLTSSEVANVQILATRKNLLALMFFGAKHTDQNARECCTFIEYPREQRCPVDTKDRS